LLCLQLIGAPCGTHGQYTFYKAFKYCKSGRQNILALNEFVFIKLWSDSDIVSIGELQQLWVDKTSDQTLASLRLYILPENTPEGRTDVHGEVSRQFFSSSPLIFGRNFGISSIVSSALRESAVYYMFQVDEFPRPGFPL